MTDKWEFKHSFFTSARRSIAWAWWSDMQNLAQMEGVTIELDGPFQTGPKGRTISAKFTQPWELLDVIPQKRLVIAGREAGFELTFAWDFDDEGAGTRMTQTISASGGENQMKQWADTLRQMEINAPNGMKRLAAKLDGLASM